jgi:hypothetical protein
MNCVTQEAMRRARESTRPGWPLRFPASVDKREAETPNPPPIALPSEQPNDQ